MEIDREKVHKVAARKVKRLAEEVSLYMKLLDKSKALRQTANSLAEGGKEGYNFGHPIAAMMLVLGIVCFRNITI